MSLLYIILAFVVGSVQQAWAVGKRLATPYGNTLLGTTVLLLTYAQLVASLLILDLAWDKWAHRANNVCFSTRHFAGRTQYMEAPPSHHFPGPGYLLNHACLSAEIIVFALPNLITILYSMFVTLRAAHQYLRRMLVGNPERYVLSKIKLWFLVAYAVHIIEMRFLQNLAAQADQQHRGWDQATWRHWAIGAEVDDFEFGGARFWMEVTSGCITHWGRVFLVLGLPYLRGWWCDVQSARGFPAASKAIEEDEGTARKEYARNRKRN